MFGHDHVLESDSRSVSEAYHDRKLALHVADPETLFVSDDLYSAD